MAKVPALRMNESQTPALPERQPLHDLSWAAGRGVSAFPDPGRSRTAAITPCLDAGRPVLPTWEDLFGFCP